MFSRRGSWVALPLKDGEGGSPIKPSQQYCFSCKLYLELKAILFLKEKCARVHYVSTLDWRMGIQAKLFLWKKILSRREAGWLYLERRWPCHEDHSSSWANSLLSHVLTVHHVLKRWLTQGSSGRQVILLPGTGFLHISGQRCLNPGKSDDPCGKPGICRVWH